jgi:ubiquitin carboxyl-terminal hydrolase 7
MVVCNTTKTIRGGSSQPLACLLILMSLMQEIKPGMIELMKPKFTFTQSEIQDGDIICFQVDINEKELVLFCQNGDNSLMGCLCRVHDLDAQGLYSNPTQYYDFLQNRVMIVFRPKFEDPDHEHPDFSLILSKKQNYDMVCRSTNRL